MTRTAVDLKELDRLVSRMAAFEQRLDDLETEVGRRVEQLQAGWWGSAAAAHGEIQQRWAAGAAEMRMALADLRAIAAAAHANYESAVRTNVGMWCR